MEGGKRFTEQRSCSQGRFFARGTQRIPPLNRFSIKGESFLLRFNCQLTRTRLARLKVSASLRTSVACAWLPGRLKNRRATRVKWSKIHWIPRFRVILYSPTCSLYSTSNFSLVPLPSYHLDFLYFSLCVVFLSRVVCKIRHDIIT